MKQRIKIPAVPQILNELHQNGHSGGGGVASVDNALSLSQLLLQVLEGLLIDPGEPGGLDLVGAPCQSLGAHCQVLVRKT